MPELPEVEIVRRGLQQVLVGREVTGAPRFEKCRRVGTEFDEEIAQLLTLECIKQDLGHGRGLYPRAGVGSG